MHLVFLNSRTAAITASHKELTGTENEISTIAKCLYQFGNVSDYSFVTNESDCRLVINFLQDPTKFAIEYLKKKLPSGKEVILRDERGKPFSVSGPEMEEYMQQEGISPTVERKQRVVKDDPYSPEELAEIKRRTDFIEKFKMEGGRLEYTDTGYNLIDENGNIIDTVDFSKGQKGLAGSTEEEEESIQTKDTTEELGAQQYPAGIQGLKELEAIEEEENKNKQELNPKEKFEKFKRLETALENLAQKGKKIDINLVWVTALQWGINDPEEFLSWINRNEDTETFEDFNTWLNKYKKDKSTETYEGRRRIQGTPIIVRRKKTRKVGDKYKDVNVWIIKIKQTGRIISTHKSQQEAEYALEELYGPDGYPYYPKDILEPISEEEANILRQEGVAEETIANLMGKEIKPTEEIESVEEQPQKSQVGTDNVLIPKFKEFRNLFNKKIENYIIKKEEEIKRKLKQEEKATIIRKIKEKYLDSSLQSKGLDPDKYKKWEGSLSIPESELERTAFTYEGLIKLGFTSKLAEDLINKLDAGEEAEVVDTKALEEGRLETLPVTSGTTEKGTKVITFPDPDNPGKTVAADPNSDAAKNLSERYEPIQAKLDKWCRRVLAKSGDKYVH